MKKNLHEIGERYRKENERLESLKHIGEIEKKIRFIDQYRLRRQEMLRKKEAMDRERSQLYPQSAEMAVEWARRRTVSGRVTYVEKEVLEESEVVV